jgi:hypothetical protein
MQLPFGSLEAVFISPFILGGYIVIGASTKKLPKAILLALAWSIGMNLLGVIMGPDQPGAVFWIIQVFVAILTTGTTFGIASWLRSRR